MGLFPFPLELPIATFPTPCRSYSGPFPKIPPIKLRPLEQFDIPCPAIPFLSSPKPDFHKASCFQKQPHSYGPICTVFFSCPVCCTYSKVPTRWKAGDCQHTGLDYLYCGKDVGPPLQ